VLPAVLHHRAGRDGDPDGRRVTGEPSELERLLALVISFTGTVALCWCYFQRAEGIGVEVAEDAEDAGAMGRQGNKRKL